MENQRCVSGILYLDGIVFGPRLGLGLGGGIRSGQERMSKDEIQCLCRSLPEFSWPESDILYNRFFFFFCERGGQ